MYRSSIVLYMYYSNTTGTPYSNRSYSNRGRYSIIHVPVRLYSCTSGWHMCWQQEKCTESTIQIVTPASNCGSP